jgi:hypothetical protein
MLPPESSTQTGPSPSTRPVRSAASPAAPAPSTTSFRALEQEQDRLRDLLVADVHHLVEQLVEDRARELALPLDEDPVRDRVARAAGADADEADVRP